MKIVGVYYIVLKEVVFCLVIMKTFHFILTITEKTCQWKYINANKYLGDKPTPTQWHRT